MRPKKSPAQRRSGNDRFGYRPTPEKRLNTGAYPHQIAQNARQEMLDKIEFSRQSKRWREENIARGRERWNDFGNKDLPIIKHKHDIMQMVSSNRISLLSGETGSGKSTQLAQYALEMGYDHIVYLQPRRVTTDNISERIDEELTAQFAEKGIDKPDSLVGMAHSEHSTLQDNSVIQVMTSAVFKKRGPQLQQEWRDKKVLIVADEVHEGNIETEFAVAMSAEMMTEQENWNMVLMSATMNEEEIQQAYTPINGKAIPKLHVEGRPHEIEQNEEPEKNVVDVFTDSCQDGNKTLIFTEGMRSIEAIKSQLQRRHPELRLLTLSSKITDEERRAIFHEEVEGVHTVIISTSAGQSGLTISGVDRVISDGWTKSPELDEESAEGLPSRLCTKSELTQQMGRGGRDIDGAMFFLTKQLPYGGHERNEEASRFVAFDERQEHAPADIYHTIITSNVLSAAAMGRDFYSLNEFLIHSVSHETIEEAYQVLRMMGAVNSDNECTPVGRAMDRLAMRPELSRALVEAMQFSTKQQQKRLAAIAVAIEAGGLGHADPKSIERNVTNLPHWAQDDFLAELAYMDYLQKTIVQEGEAIVPELRLDHTNAKRAFKQYRKTSQKLGIWNEEDFGQLDTDLTPEQIEELKTMLIKGMPHLIFEEVGRRRHRGRVKKTLKSRGEKPLPTILYRNILGPNKDESYEYDRTVSNRSVLGRMAIARSDLIAGYPRWYIDDNGTQHNVIEKGFALDKHKVELGLGSAALSVHQSSMVGPDGRLRAVTASSIGSLQVGRHQEKTYADTDQKVEQLVDVALKRPGSAQRELRELKRITEDIAGRIPKSQRQYYFDSPTLTTSDIDRLVREAATGVASVGQLDSALRNMMYRQNITLDSYISAEKLEMAQKHMPDTYVVHDNEVYDLHYEDISYSEGPERVMPYITNFPPHAAAAIGDATPRIPDGREILFKYHYGDGDERYLTLDEVRAMGGNAV